MFLPAHAAIKAGAKCTVKGQIKTSNGKTFTCTKSGKKMVWKNILTTEVSTLGGKSSPQTTSKTLPESNSSLIDQVIKIDKSLNPVSDCKISDQRIRKSQPNNVGFPITKQEIPIAGKIKVIFLPIDFADARGSADPSIRSKGIANQMKAWFTHFSGGKFNIEDQHSKLWFHSPKNSADYSNIHPGTTGNNHTAPLANSLAQDWVDLAKDSFDFSGVTTIFFEFPESVKGFGNGTQGRNINLKTNQGNIQVMFNIMGNDWFTEGFMGVTNKFRADHFWAFYIHEMFHSMGLAQHAPGNGIPLSIAANNTGTPEGFSGVLDPWELLLLDWLTESEVFCAVADNLSSNTVLLTPIDVVRQGVKTAIVRLSNHQVLVITSRRPEEWSSELPSSAKGVQVFEVDTFRDRNEDGVQRDADGTDNGNNPTFSKWAFYLLPDGISGGYEIRRSLTDYILKKGQTVTFQGIKVEYIEAGLNDLVRISKLSR